MTAEVRPPAAAGAPPLLPRSSAPKPWMFKQVCTLCGVALLLATLAACNREERAHEIHLAKGGYAGKPMTKLDDGQVKALEQRAANEKY